MNLYTRKINTWHEIVRLYKDAFGVDERTLELISVFDILRLYAQGLGYNSISRILDSDIPYIKYAVKQFYRVEAREHDLDISPIMCYNSKQLDSLSKTDLKMCRIYLNLERKINIYERT